MVNIGHKGRVALVLLTMLLVVGIAIWQHYSRAKVGIRVGVLHSLSGPMAISEKPLVDAIHLSIEEANAEGGINGRKIEAVVVDCEAGPEYCAQQAERLIRRSMSRPCSAAGHPLAARR